MRRVEVSEQFLTDTLKYLQRYAREHPHSKDVHILIGYAWSARWQATQDTREGKRNA